MTVGKLFLKALTICIDPFERTKLMQEASDMK